MSTKQDNGRKSTVYGRGVIYWERIYFLFVNFIIYKTEGLLNIKI